MHPSLVPAFIVISWFWWILFTMRFFTRCFLVRFAGETFALAATDLRGYLTLLGGSGLTSMMASAMALRQR
jgi:hypothetical protein